jgi:hypothetical protein
MGKGSKPRPFDVDRQTYEDNWDRIFSKRSAVVGPTKYAIKVGSGENSYYVTEDTGSCTDLVTEVYDTLEEAEAIANTIRSSGVGFVEVVKWLN